MIRLLIALLVCLLIASHAPAQTNSSDIVSTREMERINWMEFREVVPSKIQTVLLPTGTLEPHGVANNGADITAPVAICRQIAKRLNAMIAPVLPYGMTGSMEAYPGAFQITESAYRPFIKQVMEGLAKNGFKNIIIINGHGGGQTAPSQPRWLCTRPVRAGAAGLGRWCGAGQGVRRQRQQGAMRSGEKAV